MDGSSSTGRKRYVGSLCSRRRMSSRKKPVAWTRARERLISFRSAYWPGNTESSRRSTRSRVCCEPANTISRMRSRRPWTMR